MAKATYHHLTKVLRYYNKAELSGGCSYRVIARKLLITTYTVSREGSSQSGPRGWLRSQTRHRTEDTRRRHAFSRPRKLTARHLDHVNDRLLAQQNPDVISHRTSDPSLKLTTAWIYELLQCEVAKGDDEWVTLLHRKFRRRHGPRRGKAGVRLIPLRG